MEPCNLSYIPERLHSNDKPDIVEFFLGEYIYRRCPIDKITNCFDTINLYDVSVNRQGHPENPISEKEDALYNIRDDIEIIKFKEAVVPFKIMELVADQYYKKVLVEDVDGAGKEYSLLCEILLKHKKVPCNYSHASFDFIYKGELVTRANYKDTLGKKGKKYSELRTKCKHEIYTMHIKEEVWINWPEK